MIKITSFHPFSNILRITQEFDEDKVVVKSKSLTFEREIEFKYEDVNEISDAFMAQNAQQSFGFSVTLITGMLLYILCPWLYENLFWLRIGQLFFIAGLLLYIISFVRNWYIFIYDKNGNALTIIRQTRDNKSLVLQAIEKIKEKSNNLEEMTSAEAFPHKKSVFDYSYFKFDDLRRLTDKFYENEIIGVDKGINGESSYKIKYSDLTGKVYKEKKNNDLSKLVFPCCVLIFAISYGLIFGFNINLYVSPLYILYTLIIAVLVSALLGYIKREIFGFYTKDGNIGYWAYINKNEKEKVGKIIEYVQSRIPAENKE